MSIENTGIIDIVSIDGNGNAVLTIADHLRWDDIRTHSLLLQNKINAYLDAVESESLFERYPEARGRKIIINLVTKYWPTTEGEIFLIKVEEVLESEGYGFDFKHLKV